MDIAKNGKMTWFSKTYIKIISEKVKKLFEVTLKSWKCPLTEEHRLQLEDTLFLER